MVTAAAPSGLSLRRVLNPAHATRPAPKPRVEFATKNQPNAVKCERLRCPEARLYANAATKGDYKGGAGDARRKRLAVFVSGGGSNFRAIHEAALGGAVHGDVVALVTDKPGCGDAEHARRNGIPVVVFPKSKAAPEGFQYLNY